MRTAIDLFSGIGGFSRAAEANGIEVLCHVEIDPDCQEYLRREWPDVPVYGDIRSFQAHEYAGADIVMGGPPCQPVSCAGKRKGSEDDRWLWGEALSVVERVRPRWCLFENPPGIRNMGLDGILSHLEDLGYTVGTVDIPACAVNAPHIRQRYWIVAHNNGGRPERECWSWKAGAAECGQGHLAHNQSARHQERGMGRQGSTCEKHESARSSAGKTDGSHLAHGGRLGRREDVPQQGPLTRDADGRDRAGDVGNAERTDGRWQREQVRSTSRPLRGDDRSEPWGDAYHWAPCADGKIRRTPDDSFLLAHGSARDVIAQLAEEGWPKRSVLKALGNSIVWQVAAEVIRAMVEADNAR